MHLVGDRQGLLPECSAGYLESRRLKLKHKWQLTACLLQIIDRSLPQAVQFRSRRWFSGRARQDGKGQWRSEGRALPGTCLAKVGPAHVCASISVVSAMVKRTAGARPIPMTWLLHW